MKSITLFFLIIIISVFACAIFAEAPANYYNNAYGKSGSELKTALHDIIKNHTRLSYDAAYTALETIDQDPAVADNVLDVYKNASHLKSDHSPSGWSREHTWPKSYGFPDDASTNYPYTDCHHLMASDASYNNSRSNKYFDDCTSGCSEYPATGTIYSNWADSDSWEVWNGRKGDIARAMFYMDVRYEGGDPEPDLRLTDNASLIISSDTNQTIGYMGLYSTLVQWHKDDPVDDKERLRNDRVYGYQNNRNPYIDHPEWVGAVYGFEPTPTPTATPEPTPTSIYTPTPTPSGSVAPAAGDVVINEIDYDDAEGDNYSFVELKNISSKNIDLSKIEIVFLNNSPTATYGSHHISTYTLYPGEYYVLTTKDDSTSLTLISNETMTTVSSLQNGPNDGAYLRLFDTPATIIDSVCYEGSTAHPAGSPDSGNAGTDPNGVSDETKSLSRYPDGTDTGNNATDFQVKTSTPGQSNGGVTPTPTSTPSPTPSISPTPSLTPAPTKTPTPTPDVTPSPTPEFSPTPSPTPEAAPNPLAGEIVINEIDYNDYSTDDQSFIEIKNTSSKTFDLSSIKLIFLNNSSTTTYATYEPAANLLLPGAYFVFGTVSDSASVAADVDETMSGVASLQNGPNDGVYICLKSDTTVIIDSVSYQGSIAHPANSTDSGDAGTDTDGIADDFKSLSRIPDAKDTNINNADFQFVASTPGRSNDGTTPTPTPSPTPISPTPTPTITPTPSPTPATPTPTPISSSNTGMITY